MNRTFRTLGLVGALVGTITISGCKTPDAISDGLQTINPFSYSSSSPKAQSTQTPKETGLLDRIYTNGKCPELTICKGVGSQLVNPSIYNQGMSMEDKVDASEEYQANLWRNAFEVAEDLKDSGERITLLEFQKRMEAERDGDHYMAAPIGAANAAIIAGAAYGAFYGKDGNGDTVLDNVISGAKKVGNGTINFTTGTNTQ